MAYQQLRTDSDKNAYATDQGDDQNPGDQETDDTPARGDLNFDVGMVDQLALRCRLNAGR